MPLLPVQLLPCVCAVHSLKVNDSAVTDSPLGKLSDAQRILGMKAQVE